METFKVEITPDRMQEAVTKAVEIVLKSEYSNPVKDIVEKAIKEKGNEIESVVKQMISDSMNQPEFKEKLGAIVLQNMVAAAMKR